MAKINCCSVFALLACLVAADAAGAPLLQNGQGNLCLATCPQTLQYLPVCGSDGVTYPNPSALGCYTKCVNGGLRALYYGACATASVVDKYPYVDEQGNACPLCAVTYENYPVCGSNGKTYPNPSTLRCHSSCLKGGVTQLYHGECRAVIVDPYHDEQGNACPLCPVTYDYSPVCGSNGITYTNLSVLQCHNKCLKGRVTQVHRGECRTATA